MASMSRSRYPISSSAKPSRLLDVRGLVPASLDRDKIQSRLAGPPIGAGHSAIGERRLRRTQGPGRPLRRGCRASTPRRARGRLRHAPLQGRRRGQGHRGPPAGIGLFENHDYSVATVHGENEPQQTSDQELGKAIKVLREGHYLIHYLDHEIGDREKEKASLLQQKKTRRASCERIMRNGLRNFRTRSPARTPRSSNSRRSGPGRGTRSRRGTLPRSRTSRRRSQRPGKGVQREQ